MAAGAASAKRAQFTRGDAAHGGDAYRAEAPNAHGAGVIYARAARVCRAARRACGLSHFRRVRGSCGKSAFCAEEKLYFRAGNFWLNVPDAALWWPKNYGKPALYDVRAELVRGGEVLATAACRTPF